MAAAFIIVAAACTQAALTPRADSLMARRGLRSLEEAVDLYEKALAVETKPDPMLQLKLADALNGVMRVKTNANTLVVDRLLDTPVNKEVWGKLGPRALELATEARKARPRDVRAAAVYADAYMFSCSSKGIIKQALQGAASVFKANAERLINMDKKYDNGVGYALLGAFYAVAPWPYGNMDLAAKNMDMAKKVAPTKRNLYYVGVIAFKQKQWERATEHFRLALNARPGSPTEWDFAEFMESECKRAAAMAQTELQKCTAASDTRR